MAPHSQKFYFQETAEVLHRSARSKKDFSGYRAALGWQAVGMYAGNLLSQPWRPEYREIRVISVTTYDVYGFTFKIIFRLTADFTYIRSTQI